jgi:hypothetical protein
LLNNLRINLILTWDIFVVTLSLILKW